MTKCYSNKAIALLLALVLCLAASCTAVQATGILETEESTARVLFAAPTPVFTVETISPSGATHAMDLDFGGEYPMFLADAFAYATEEGEQPDRWLKITDTHPIKPWNLTASMSLFSEVASEENEDPAFNVFAARLTATRQNVLAYRQMEAQAYDDGTGLFAGDTAWVVPSLALENTDFVLVAGGAATPLTSNKTGTRMERGIFFIRFQADGIKLDNVAPVAGESIKAEETYTAIITWTGTDTPAN